MNSIVLLHVADSKQNRVVGFVVDDIKHICQYWPAELGWCWLYWTTTQFIRVHFTLETRILFYSLVPTTTTICLWKVHFGLPLSETYVKWTFANGNFPALYFYNLQFQPLAFTLSLFLPVLLWWWCIAIAVSRHSTIVLLVSHLCTYWQINIHFSASFVFTRLYCLHL